MLSSELKDSRYLLDSIVTGLAEESLFMSEKIYLANSEICIIFIIFVEINLRIVKCLLFGTCRPPRQEGQYFLKHVNYALNT